MVSEVPLVILILLFGRDRRAGIRGSDRRESNLTAAETLPGAREPFEELGTFFCIFDHHILNLFPIFDRAEDAKRTSSGVGAVGCRVCSQCVISHRGLKTEEITIWNRSGI